MLFMVHSDTGSCIRAYCIPDSFSAHSSLKIIVDGALVDTVEPNEHHAQVSQRHATGQIGFVIDESRISGLAGITDLELRDAESDLLIYRRLPATPVYDLMLFRLETRLMPFRALDMVLKPKFRFWYERLDRYSAETVRQILLFTEFRSVYTSGRVLFSNYDYYLYNKHKTVTLLRDPFEELAERLLVFSHVKDAPGRVFNERDALVFAPALTFAAQVGDFEKADLSRSFKRATPDVLAVLSNPLTRQLTAATPDAPAEKGSVSKALRILAEFELVGIEDDEDTFLRALTELLGDADLVLPKAKSSPRVTALAAQLRSLRLVRDLLENDRDVYRHVQAAHKGG